MAPRLRPFWMVPALLTAGAVRIGAQNPTAACSQPTQVVQAQVDAFNHHDLEAFLATYAPDAELRVLPADSVLLVVRRRCVEPTISSTTYQLNSAWTSPNASPLAASSLTT